MVFALVLLAVLIGYGMLLWTKTGVFAGGADSAGYLGSARLLSEGHLRAPIRTLPGAPLDKVAPNVYMPLGFRTVGLSELAPTYPVGLPLLITAAAPIPGLERRAAVVLVLHAVAGVLLTFWLAVECGLSRYVAALAALLVGSPGLSVRLGHADERRAGDGVDDRGNPRHVAEPAGLALGAAERSGDVGRSPDPPEQRACLDAPSRLRRPVAPAMAAPGGRRPAWCRSVLRATTWALTGSAGQRLRQVRLPVRRRARRAQPETLRRVGAGHADADRPAGPWPAGSHPPGARREATVLMLWSLVYPVFLPVLLVHYQTWW